MNVSAVNCTPIKPQAFGNEKNFDDAQKILDMSKELSDSFGKEGQDKKTKAQTLVSVLGALATTFVLGKVMAGKVLTAFPTLPAKIAEGAGKLKGLASKIKIPNAIKTSKPMTKLASNTKLQNAASVISEKAGAAIESAKGYIAEKGSDAVIKDAAGLASMAAFGSKIAKVDGNKDGVADIAQNNVNAYKNAVDQMGIIGEITKALS